MADLPEADWPRREDLARLVEVLGRENLRWVCQGRYGLFNAPLPVASLLTDRRSKKTAALPLRASCRLVMTRTSGL